MRLYQGDYGRETVFADDPLEAARRWAREGATRLHVVDLDGARDGRPVNDGPIGRILAELELPVQVAGGIRQLDVIDRYLKMGADRVVLGTAAVHDQLLVTNALALFRQAVVVSIDARAGKATTGGWVEQSGRSTDDLAQELAELGVPRFVFTDVTRDGTLRGPNFAAIGRLVRRLSVPLIAAGGITTVEHLRRLAKLGVEGAIVGRALYDGSLSLADALAAVEA